MLARRINTARASAFRVVMLSCTLASALTIGCAPGASEPGATSAVERRNLAMTADERAAARAAKQAVRQARKADRAIRKALNKVSGGITGKYIVILEDQTQGVAASAQRPLATAQRLALRHRFKRKQLFRNAVQGFSADMDESDAMDLANDPDVAYVVEDMPVEHTATQSNAPWNLDRVDQRSLPLDKTYAPAHTGKGVQVYLIDSGTLPTHTELAGKVSLDLDLVDDGRAGIDCDGHGTHVAGTIVGKTWGVAKDARVHSLRVLDCNGGGLVSDVMAALDWVISNKISPAVVNMSLSTGAMAELDEMVRQTVAAGIPVVVAAGNNGGFADDHSPSRVKEAIVVGATDVFDQRADFSNFGRAVDLFAPGVGVASSWPTSTVDTATLSGTSMATPLVTGAVALYLETNPTASPAAIETALVNSCTRGVVKSPGPGPTNRLLFTGLTAPTARPVLFVVGSTSLSSADAALRSRLQGRGYSVSLKTGSDLSSSDASGKAFVLISASVDSSDVGSKLTGVSTPVMSLEGYLFDDLKMTGARRDVDYGQLDSTGPLHLEDDFNPVAAGLRGTLGDEGWDDIVSPSTGGKPYFGVPAATAIGPDGLAITYLGNTARAAVFGYEKGATMVGRTAPARRLGFFADEDTVRTFTAQGWSLFDAAVEWVAGPGPDDSPEAVGLRVTVTSKKATLDWTAFMLNLRTQIWRSTRRGGPYTLLTTTAAQAGPFYEYVDTSAANGKTYYYVVTPLDAAGKAGHASDEVRATLAVPGAPTDTSVLLEPVEGGITLNWQRDVVASETRVARGVSSAGPFTLLDTVPAEAGETLQSYNDATVEPQHHYYYVLTPANAFGAGPASAPLEVVVEPARAPTALTGLAASPTPGGLRVTWNPVIGATSYEVVAVNAADQTELADVTTDEPDVSVWLPPNNDVAVSVQPLGHLVADPGVVQAHTGTGAAVLVVGQVPPRAGDAAVAARLTSLGLAPTIRKTEELAPGDLVGTDVLLISSTIKASALPSWLATSTTPVVLLSAFAQPTMGLVDGGPGTFGVLGNQTTWVVAPTTHDLAAGGARTTALSSTPGTMGWGTPRPGAIVIARAPSATPLASTAAAPGASLFAYDRGGALAGNVPAPARRVAFLMDADAMATLSDDGRTLFDASVHWAIDPSVNDLPAPTGLVATEEPDDVALTWTAVPGASGYAVFRARSLEVAQADLGPSTLPGIAPELIGTVGATTSFVDDSNTIGVLNTYFVQALSASGGSPLGGGASAGLTPPPGRPQITTTALSGSVLLTIKTTGLVSSLRVKRATDSGGPYVTVASTLPAGTSSYTATGLSNGTLYYFVVEAVNANGVSRSLEAFSIPQTTPAAPTGLVATVANGQLSLGWTAVAGARAYAVKRGPSGASTPTDLVSAETLVPSVVDGNLKNGVAYKYFVTTLGDPGVVSTTAATITATARGKAVLVRPATATGVEVALRDRLTALGFDITERTDAQLTAADTTGKDLVVVSSAVSSAQVGTKLTNVVTPVLDLEPVGYGNLRMTGTTAGVDFGTSGPGTQSEIVTDSHPAAGGQSGIITIASVAGKSAWGVPSSEAVVVARLAPGATPVGAPTVFVYQAGSPMVGMTAPARRAGFTLDATLASSLTAAGRALLDASISWSAGLAR